MKTMEEIEAYLDKGDFPESPIVFLNECFGRFGWASENAGSGLVVKAMISVPQGVLTIEREGYDYDSITRTFRATRATPKDAPVETKVPPKPSREVINKSIKAKSEVILSKGTKTLAELKAMVEAFGVKTKEQLSNEQATQLANQLEELL